MKPSNNIVLTVETTMEVPVEKAWKYWTEPEHITRWNFASDDWSCPDAHNDLRNGGRFSYRMEARDGSTGFDFSGKYDKVNPGKEIHYSLDDDRRVQVTFSSEGGRTTVKESFEADSNHSPEVQRQGWQAILDNFKNYTERFNRFEKLHFEIWIDKPAEKVYNTMLTKDTYEKWTAEFNPTSRFFGSWVKGTEMKFLGTNEDGSQGGMLSVIRQHIPNRYVSMEHKAVLKGSRLITTGKEAEQWIGGREEYSFKEKGGSTLVSVDTDAPPEYAAYFKETWPKALKKLKAICEQGIK